MIAKAHEDFNATGWLDNSIHKSTTWIGDCSPFYYTVSYRMLKTRALWSRVYEPFFKYEQRSSCDRFWTQCSYQPFQLLLEFSVVVCLTEVALSSYSLPCVLFILGKLGFCFHYSCNVYDVWKLLGTWWAKGRICFFVLHIYYTHLIIILTQTYLKTPNI